MEKSNNNSSETLASVTNLNCIDLSTSDIHHSVSLLKQACLDSGFFYVINHGISQEFMDEVFAQSKKFFDLPISEKLKVLRNEKHRGYTPIFDELLDPESQVQGDYKEGYYIGVEVPEDDPEAEKPFCGPNVWPASDILPGWRQTMEKYHAQALEVARSVSRIIALALDLDANFFDKPEMLGKPIATLRLLHYEVQISDPSKGIFGAGAHSDYGLITLLATDDVAGLQICKNKDAQPQIWENVPPVKGAFIVNLGDMLERWSNCVFKSTVHRVIGNGQHRYSVSVSFSWVSVSISMFAGSGALLIWKQRYTVGLEPQPLFEIAYFVEPNHECLVECLPTCKSETKPPKFPPVRCGDYLSQRYKDTHTDISTYRNHDISANFAVLPSREWN